MRAGQRTAGWVLVGAQFMLAQSWRMG